ncbi:CoA ester lyase [Sphingomonas histidinilytica]|uniref:HpcH/HpaI aldolase/citrate lyase family protein n=1 Tax=Rhizorhabdus histidinilytica TaxID=439228 RepID=UPI001ADA4C62|nr:CoA ester lyase [Rhizorhabdus histidinilytica]MBO9378868.1 CoA ester lyase [Rhizorhabdus histidinilytica]
MIDMPHSCLFVPVDQDRFVERAHERGADVILLDLEDSVTPDRKPVARSKLAGAVAHLSGHRISAWVRINAPLHDCVPDLKAACIKGVEAIMVPKASGPDHLKMIDDDLSRLEAECGLNVGGIALIALIETPQGLIHASGMAQATARLRALAFGGEDFSAALGLSPEPSTLAAYCQQLVLAAKASGLGALGIPGSIADIGDEGSFREAAALGKKFGFDGVLCVHPRQVAIVNDLYAPSNKEYDHAAKVVSAFEHALEHGNGAVMLDGKMIDLPVVRRAEAILRRKSRHRFVA